MKKLLKNKWTYILLSLLTTAILCLSLGLNFVGGGRTDLALTTNTTSADGPTNTGYWTDTATQTAPGVDFTNYTLSGSGTAESPYQINSETDLAFLSWTIYTGNVYGGDENKQFYEDMGGYLYYPGVYFEQTKDLDLSAYYWQPIGILYLRDGTSTSRYFSGNYDGGGFTISGLYTPAMPEGLTTTQQRGYSYQGLFGYVYGYSSTQATISNVGVIDSFIQGNSSVGGVVGYAYNSTITNCYNTGSVEGSGVQVGGVVGYANSNSTITNCYNTGAVTGNSSVGGVVGSGGTITNCYNTGTVTGSGSVGGVVGYAVSSSTITNCYNTGAVTGSSYVGGVVGYAYSSSTISNTYYGGECTLTTGIGSGSGTATKIDAPVDEWATNIAWYTNSSKWNSSYPWNFDTVWEFVRAPDYINLHYIINNGYPVLCGMWSIPDDAEIIYWTDEIAQNALGVDFTNYTLSGSGTAESPYQINSETDLAFLSWTIYTDNVYGGDENKQFYEDMGGYLYYPGVYFEQTKDLDLSAYYWQPIGYMSQDMTQINTFAGNYNGGSYTISSMYVPEIEYSGLFGAVCGSPTAYANISNINIKDSLIKGINYVAGIAGTAMFSNIDNCNYAGVIEGAAGSYVAGIVGLSSGNIKNCINLGKISGSCAGGIVAMSSEGNIISNCLNLGQVTGTSSAGGIVGSAYKSIINNCSNFGEITLISSSSYIGVGGIVGDMCGEINNCYNSGSVSDVGGYGYTGGIVGYITSNITINNCGVETTQISGNSSVGVLVGSGSYASITNCYGIVGVDIDFVGTNYTGTYDNCVWITNVDGVVNKYYHGTDFSAFAWFNQNSCPIPKSLSSLGQFWTGDITPTLTASSEWQEVA